MTNRWQAVLSLTKGSRAPPRLRGQSPWFESPAMPCRAAPSGCNTSFHGLFPPHLSHSIATCAEIQGGNMRPFIMRGNTTDHGGTAIQADVTFDVHGKPSDVDRGPMLE